MKYIRTKNGVFDYEKKIKGIKFYRKDTAWIRKNVYYWIKKDIQELDKSILKQADTIEELCDEIVEIIDGKAQVVYADISFNDLAITKIRDKNNAIVYGAIWIEWGLKYVAKMNDKGELELL